MKTLNMNEYKVVRVINGKRREMNTKLYRYTDPNKYGFLFIPREKAIITNAI